MDEYHKIQTVFKRDMENGGKRLLLGEWTKDEFWYLADSRWVFTEKVDGTNIRVMWDGENVRFGGRTDKANIPTKLLSSLQDMFQPSVFNNLFDGPVCLYGEGYGAGIQKGGGNYSPEQTFVLFDVKIGGWWLRRDDVAEVAENMGIRVVPVVGGGTLYDGIKMVEAGFASTWGDFDAEGIVARPEVELRSRSGERIITKIKTCDFK